jgi:hypothetical protein
MAKKASTAGRKRAATTRSQSGRSERARSTSRSAQRTSVSDTKTGTEPPRKSIEDHSEHPESPGDSTVRHADNPEGKPSAGKKGFPQGEYDVSPPAKRGAAKKDPTTLAIEQGLSDDELVTIKAALKHPKANRLKGEQRALALEALPIGTIIEHEGRFRWRVKAAPTGGGNRFGHGSTLQEAIDNYLLGSSVQTIDQAGAEAFTALPKSTQQEIEERDAAVAKRQGVSPESFPEVRARREFQENQKAAGKAERPAPNATTDGPEVASAQLEAGAKRGRAETDDVEGKQAKAARKRSSARRRTGAKARR